METEIIGKNPALIALSGGVDSAIVLALAAKAGAAKGAATIISEFTAESEVIRAEKTAAEFGIVWYPLRITLLPALSKNPENRCYLCKKRMAEELTALANKLGCSAVYDGSHAGDNPQDRPGFAAFQEAGIKARFVKQVLKNPTFCGLLMNSVLKKCLRQDVLQPVSRAK